MNQPTIITPVIKYWGCKEHPFADYILDNQALDLFVNRDQEIHRLHNCLTNRLTGVAGTPGVGKSSFLRKFKSELQNIYPVAYVEMAGKSEKLLFRETLKAILDLMRKKKIKTTRKVNINLEFERLKNSFQLTRQSEFGASALMLGKISETKTQNIKAHDEQTALTLIQRIIQGTKTPFVVIIDDMERIKFLLENDAAYFRFIVAFSRTVHEGLNHPGVSFIISLDDNFAKRVGNYDNPTIEDDNTLSFGALIQIKNFPPKHLLQIIKTRLIKYKWGGDLDKFITEKAFWLLQHISGGHARRALSALRSAMEYVEFNHLECQITTDAIIRGITEMRGRNVDLKQVPIIDYLLDNGPTSPSDKDLINAVGLSRPSLQKQMKVLHKQLGLEVTSDETDAKAKKLYRFPNVWITQ